MKNYRNALAALVLAFVLSTSAFAGDGIIQCGIAAPLPPPSATGIITTGLADGIMSTGTPESVPGESDSLTEIALSLLRSALPLV
jgi:hypothetical protein